MEQCNATSPFTCICLQPVGYHSRSTLHQNVWLHCATQKTRTRLRCRNVSTKQSESRSMRLCTTSSLQRINKQSNNKLLRCLTANGAAGGDIEITVISANSAFVVLHQEPALINESDALSVNLILLQSCHQMHRQQHHYSCRGAEQTRAARTLNGAHV